MQERWLLSAFAGLWLGASGCIVEPGAPGKAAPERKGLLTVTWSIDEDADPRACRRHGAATIDIVVYDRRGARVAEERAECEDLSATVELPEGEYRAQASLTDRAGSRVSAPLRLEDIDIRSGTELTITTDFPSGGKR